MLPAHTIRPPGDRGGLRSQVSLRGAWQPDAIHFAPARLTDRVDLPGPTSAHDILRGAILTTGWAPTPPPARASVGGEGGRPRTVH